MRESRGFGGGTGSVGGTGVEEDAVGVGSAMVVVVGVC